MKYRKLVVLIAMMIVSLSALAASPLAGKWQGDLDGKPTVILNLSDREGKISGTAVFNILKRVDGAVTVVPGSEQAVLNPRLDGKTFTFNIEVSREDGTQDIVNFRIDLLNDNEAMLKRLSGEQPGSEVKMVRQGNKVDRCERCF